MRREAPLIVGGGPAGSAAAIRLAHGGAKPRLLERQSETGDALCGGFLSWRTLKTLAALGLDAPGGHAVESLRLFAGARVAAARLPKPAIGLSRHALDSRLLALAERAGAGVERGVAARGWVDGVLTTTDGAALDCPSLFLATGKYDLRGLPRPRDAGQTLGLRLRLPASPALSRLCRGAIELHLFDGGYCGLVLQEGERGNLCLAVRKARLAEAGGEPMLLLRQWAEESGTFAERLALAEGEPDAIGAVPYGWIARETDAGLYRLGDQAAVIPSLAGEGNGMALASGIMAAEAWLGGEGAQSYQRRFARAARNPVRLARLLWHLAEHPLGAQAMVRLTALAPWVAARLAGQTRIAA